MNDDEIRESILEVLSGTPFELLHFGRDHMVFGNMVVEVKSVTNVLIFVTDRGDISCNGDLLFPSSYHVAGEDDTPVYLLTAMRQVLTRLCASFQR